MGNTVWISGVCLAKSGQTIKVKRNLRPVECRCVGDKYFTNDGTEVKPKTDIGNLEVFASKTKAETYYNECVQNAILKLRSIRDKIDEKIKRFEKSII